MSDETATVRAWIDNTGTKPLLQVEGTVLVYASDFDISAEPSVPEDFNSTICGIDVRIVERPSPMKGIMQSWRTSKVISGEPYQQVRVAFTYEPEPEAGSRIAEISGSVRQA